MRFGARATAVAVVAAAAWVGCATYEGDGDEGQTINTVDPAVIASACDAVCACIGCARIERIGCVTDAREEATEAEVRGCAAEFTAHLTCAVTRSVCVHDQFRISEHACAEALSRLHACERAVADGGERFDTEAVP
jgi:hypothetical protein